MRPTKLTINGEQDSGSGTADTSVNCNKLPPLVIARVPFTPLELSTEKSLAEKLVDETDQVISLTNDPAIVQEIESPSSIGSFHQVAIDIDKIQCKGIGSQIESNRSGTVPYQSPNLGFLQAFKLFENGIQVGMLEFPRRIGFLFQEQP